MKHLLRALALLLLTSLLALSAIAIVPGSYGYYDANGDGKIEIVDVLTILRALLNSTEEDTDLLRVLRTAKTTTTSEPVDAILISVDTENETVVLSGEHLESFTVPFATLGLTADTDFDALLNESVTLTVPAPAEKFFESYDADKLLAGRPVPLIELPEDPEVPTAPAVQDITFSPSGTYLKFTVTPPADETGIARYMLLLSEAGNENGHIGWPVNAEYCEYIGLERFDPTVNYDTATVYAYDAEGNTLSEYTETIAITHTDATVNIEAAYYEHNGGYGGVFFSEALPSSYVLSFYDTNENKLAFQNWMDAGSTVSDLYEYDGYSLADVAEVGIAHSKSVTVGEENTLNITTVGSNRVTLKTYPEERRLGAASNPHINEFGCIAWDVPEDLPAGSYSYAFLRNEDGDWIDPGYSTMDHMYALDAFPAGNYDMILIYTAPAWETQALYGYGVFRSTFILSIGDEESGGDNENALPAVTDVSFDASYSRLYVDFEAPVSPAFPEYKLYLYNGSAWTGSLATSWGESFALSNTDIATGTYTKLRIVSTDEWSGYADGVFETDCSLTVTANRGNVTLNAYTLDGEYAFYYTDIPTDKSVQVYAAESPSMTKWRTSFGLDTDETGAGVRLVDVDPDYYFRIQSYDEATVTDPLTASFAYTLYSDWSKLSFAEPTTDNSIFTEVGFKAVHDIPAFAYTPAEADRWQNFILQFSANGGESWVGLYARDSSSVALGNREWLEIEDTTTYNKVRVIRFADGVAKQYIADCSFTLTHSDLTLPAPQIGYDEEYGMYAIVYADLCPVGASYVYHRTDSDGRGASWGSFRNYGETPSDIAIRDHVSSPADFIGCTVRIRILDNVTMDGMTCTATLADSGTHTITE